MNVRLEDATPGTPNDPDPGSTREVVLEDMAAAAASRVVGEDLVLAPEGVRGLRGTVWSDGVSIPFLAFLKGVGGRRGGIDMQKCVQAWGNRINVIFFWSYVVFSAFTSTIPFPKVKV